jgi:hypothetical protein
VKSIEDSEIYEVEAGKFLSFMKDNPGVLLTLLETDIME